MATQIVETGAAKRKSPRLAKADAIAKAKAVAPDLAARIGSTPRTKFRGDPDVFGRVYLGFKGSGWAYGEPARCEPAPFSVGDATECLAIR